MRFINFLIFLLAIPPAILSTIQLLDQSIPVVSPIYSTIVHSVSAELSKVTAPKATVETEASVPSTSSTAAAAPADSTASSEPTEPATTETSAPAESFGVSPETVNLGALVISVLVGILALVMFRSRRA